MLLMDDAQHSLIEPLGALLTGSRPTYDFALMQQSGSVRGWAISGVAAHTLQQQFERFAACAAGQQGGAPLVYAVGDGNHSLATAKACYEQLKKQLPREQWEQHPARWALVELVNLHDPSLVFEAIHRVAFGVQPQALLDALAKETDALILPEGAALPQGADPAQAVGFYHAEGSGTLLLRRGGSSLAVGRLQQVLDGYLGAVGGTMDYIHGKEVTCSLARQPGNLGFVLPDMEKAALFPAVQADGALPRKTFSMGKACDKRFYLECRRIEA
jgi:hypothetical protein